MIITHYWFCLLEKSIFSALATFGKDGKKFHLVLIAKGITTIAESNWFGSGRNINGNQRKPKSKPNPYYNISSSRFHAIKELVLQSLTDHSLKEWKNKETRTNYIKKLEYKFIPPLPPPIDFYEEINRIYLLMLTQFTSAKKILALLLSSILMSQ